MLCNLWQNKAVKKKIWFFIWLHRILWPNFPIQDSAWASLWQQWLCLFLLCPTQTWNYQVNLCCGTFLNMYKVRTITFYFPKLTKNNWLTILCIINFQWRIEKVKHHHDQVNRNDDCEIIVQQNDNKYAIIKKKEKRRKLEEGSHNQCVT